jgi:glycine oxidase
MRADILIIGQGLAGTLLGWEFERAGIPFTIADGGRGAASTAAAGLINPVTGQRLVKNWRIETLLPAARAAYREMEAAFGMRLWTDLRIRRVFADEREGRIFAQKCTTGELAPYVSGAAEDSAECWIESAARVDVRGLLGTARHRWSSRGWLRAHDTEVRNEIDRHQVVIDCTGVRAARSADFGFVPWEFSKGEALEIEVTDWPTDVAVKAHHAVVPFAPGRVWVGATHEPNVIDGGATAAARAALETSARACVARPFRVAAQLVGVRVNVPDKRPVAGRHPHEQRLGLINALGAKGALLAPWLARQWVNHLTEGVAFDAAVSPARFSARHSSQSLSR